MEHSGGCPCAIAYGDLDPATRRVLDQSMKARSLTEVAGKLDTLEREQEAKAAGTVLMREWKGGQHRVMVMANGFAWKGKTYQSLSSVAFAITGTKWNGPRFFG